MPIVDPDFTFEAKALGYYPFIRFSPIEYLTMINLYGDFPFNEVFPRLRDPLKLYPGWAAGLMGALAVT